MQISSARFKAMEQRAEHHPVSYSYYCHFQQFQFLLTTLLPVPNQIYIYM